MNPWAARRRAIIFVIVLIGLILVVGWPVYYFYVRSVPNCSNGKQDGDETGVDCGGSCQLICKPEILPLITQGDARLLKIATSTYEVVALVQNPNISARVVRAPYTFTIYSGSGSDAVKVITGDTSIDRSSTFAVFAGPFDLDATGAMRVTFTWGNLTWEKNSDKATVISVQNMNLITASTSLPRLEAVLANKSLVGASNIEAVALLTDASGTIIGAGKTFVDSLAAGASAPIVFSWPTGFAAEPVSIRIIPHILPDKSYLH